MSSGVDVKLLGPLDVRVPGGPVQFEGAKQRTLFTALALRASEPVSVDELVDALWADDPPGDGVQALQKQVSRLRRRLGPAVPIQAGAAGYALGLDRAAIDAHRFEELLGRARAALEAGRPDPAREDLEAALALWRGPPLADHRFEPFAQRESRRLEELRMEAIEERMSAELAGGRDADLVGELRALVAEHPLRERLRGHLMVSLYRGGRQAEALEVMREGRRMLVDELGIEPGPELRRLERMILAHDPELAPDRPAPRQPAALPAPADDLVGREGELAEITGLLTRPGTRLLTLVGTGGVGKTRLALEAARHVAERFGGGAVLVDLDGVDDPRLLASEAAAALGAVAATAEELREQLARAHRAAPTLLVLDGFERFVDDAGEVARLLAAVEGLTVLATSRAALRLSGEHVYSVHPLAPPNAAALFAARAGAARAGWAPREDDREIVEAICARLDGLPLAIELAADRVRLLPLPALLTRLERRLELLTDGARDRPPRQRSLRATLEWSWEVLDEDERRLLCLLTVFEGGASLEAVTEVCGDGRVDAVLASLLDKTSLLRTDVREQEPRFAMLETIREFACERAADYPEVAEAELRHARYFVGYSERLAKEAARAHRRDSLERLAAERANLRLAHERLLHTGAADEALRVAIAFAEALPWDVHAHEARGWLAGGLAALPDDEPALRATALYWDGRLAISQARFDDAESQLRAALAAAREAREPALEAAVLVALGRWATLVASDEAAALGDAALAAARASGDDHLIADSLLTVAGACERASSWDRAAGLATDALALYRTVGDPYGVAAALAELGWYDMVIGNGERAEACFDEALALRQRHGDDRRLVEPLINGAWLALVQGDSGTAQARFLDCVALAREVDDRFLVGEALAGLSAVAGSEGRWSDCAQLAGASAVVHEEIGAPPLGVGRDAAGARDRGGTERARPGRVRAVRAARPLPAGRRRAAADRRRPGARPARLVSDVRAEDEFVTVGTKLLVPERRRGLIARPELCAALEAGRERRATVVSAPTGFGKTSALTEWAAASPARFAWVALDAGDDDPARFWSYVIAAVEGAAPELPGTAGRRLRGPGVAIGDEVLPVLVNELAMVADPLVLVLDDYHVIEAEEIHAGVNYLLERLGPGVHVVLATQQVPPLRLGRLRARGELNEYHAEALRFSEAEVAALLGDLELTPEDLSALHRRTEGWVAGLNLVALSLRNTGDRAAFMARMPVDDRFLVDYLWDEVVVQQPPETRDFLMRTAVLERLSGELCDLVAERRDSADVLLALERSNLFVVPLDPERRWFRYHTLFRAMLLRQLERHAPDSVADLHRRASAWFADRGDLQGTIEHAISAGDVHVAADTLRRNWLALYNDGHATEAIGWIDRLPGATLADYPELALARGGMARAMGRPTAEIEPWLARAEQAARATANARDRAELAAGVARQRAMLRLAHADIGAAVRLARAAAAGRPSDSPEAPSDAFFLAVCLFWTGSSRESETLLRGYLEATPPGEQDVRRVFAIALLALAHAARGELDLAARLVDESLATSEARGLSEHPPTELAFVASGVVQLARGDGEAAEDRLEHAVTLARRGGDRIEIAQALLWLGRCRAQGEDAGGGADALAAARAQLGGARVPGLVRLEAALEAEIGDAAPGRDDGALLAGDELRVLELLPGDLTYAEIAERLALPAEDVHAPVRRIRRTLQAVTRDEAVTAARRLELL